MKRPLGGMLSCVLLTVSLAATSAPEDGTAEGAAEDPVLQRAAEASARADWPGAAAILRQGLAADPGKAEYHNRYAYALRKGANPDMRLVFKHYDEALKLDPKHRGAHEYIGEAYLMVGNLAKAREHLKALDKLCFLPCVEYSELKKAIAEYEKKPAAR